jgi:hypothetical protein
MELEPPVCGRELGHDALVARLCMSGKSSGLSRKQSAGQAAIG